MRQPRSSASLPRGWCATAVALLCAISGPGYGNDDLAPIDLSERLCPNAVALSSAKSVLMGKSVTIEMNGSALCLTDGLNQKNVYAAVLLPESETEYLVTVLSEPNEGYIFSPKIAALAEDGETIREWARDRFTFRGHDLRIVIRSQPNLRYLVVYSDVKRAGEPITQVESGFMQSMISTGTAFVPFGMGTEITRTLTPANVGTLIISAAPMPKVN